MKILSIAAAGTAVFLAAAVPAKASTVTETYDFTATGISGSPVTTWDGSFTITFDPTVLGFATLDAFSSNLDASFNPFTAVVQGPDQLVVGDNCTATGCGAGAGQAWLVFNVDNSGNNPSGVFWAINDQLSTNLSVTQTPLPAALPLFASGLGGLGLLGWRRKRKAQAVA
jgi:hypothetical protein